MAQVTQSRITAKDYFQLPEHAELDLIQLIDGQVIIGNTPIIKHQLILGNILVMLADYAKKAGGETLMLPTEVYIDTYNVYEPDVFYMAPNGQCTVDELRVTGAPELVVEILSPSTAKHDRSTKYNAYERNGVQEYWIVDPAYELVEVWTQGDSGFVRQGAYDTEDTFESSVLKETINVAEIFDVK